MVIMFAIVLSLAAIFLVYWFLKKCFPRTVDVQSTEERAEAQESLFADHTETILEDSQLNHEPPDLNREVRCAKHSVENAGREDSSVKVRSATK